MNGVSYVHFQALSDEEDRKEFLIESVEGGKELTCLLHVRGPSRNQGENEHETSNMMFLYPDLVDMSELGDGPINLDMKPPSGIGGLDPRKHASAEVGRRNVELAAEAIGRKAQELLASLPEERRSFDLKAVSPENWWLI